MNAVSKAKKSYFSHVPKGRRRRERKQLMIGLILGLFAAILAGGAIYLLQDRLTH
jgi:hypothetical protein